MPDMPDICDCTGKDRCKLLQQAEAVLCADGYVSPSTGRRVGRGNVLIEFADGLQVVTSRWAIRKVPG